MLFHARDEGIVLTLSVFHPQHIVEQQVIVVGWR